MSDLNEIFTVKKEHKDLFLSKQNVIGLGAGYKNKEGSNTGDLCLVTLVTRKVPKTDISESDFVPEEINGIKTDVIEVGWISTQNSRTVNIRPAPGGVSIGHYKVTSGTLGCVVKDKTNGKKLILSNNHVLANNNDAKLGDPILQPGTLHGGKIETDKIAELYKFQPIKYGIEQNPPTGLSKFAKLLNKISKFLNSQQILQVIKNDPTAFNVIDAALAVPQDENDILDEILEIGLVTEITAPYLGMPVMKSGKTTGLTQGNVTVLDVTIDIDYHNGNIARFENQILTTPMSQGGDSGSLLVDETSKKAVGLLFAGSNQATIHNPIEIVFSKLNISF